MSVLSVFSAPNPLPNPASTGNGGPEVTGTGTGSGSGSNFGFVSVASLTFPVLGVMGFGLIKVLDAVVPVLAKTTISELIIAGLIFVVVVVGDFAANPEGNNTVLKKVVTVLVGALNAGLLLGAYLGILTLAELAG